MNLSRFLAGAYIEQY